MFDSEINANLLSVKLKRLRQFDIFFCIGVGGETEEIGTWRIRPSGGVREFTRGVIFKSIFTYLVDLRVKRQEIDIVSDKRKNIFNA